MLNESEKGCVQSVVGTGGVNIKLPFFKTKPTKFNKLFNNIFETKQ